jgi:hypothetical protein
MKLAFRLTSAFFAVLILCSATLAWSVPRTRADEFWCWDDPPIQINGEHLAVTFGIGGNAATVSQAVDHVDVWLAVPRGTRRSVLAHQGDGPFRVNVHFQDVNVPAVAGRPVTVGVVATVALKGHLSLQAPTAIQVTEGASVIASASASTTSAIVTSFVVE